MEAKIIAASWLQEKAELETGSWSGLDESSPDKVGVGIFFKRYPDGSFRVASIVPGSSAFKSGVINIGDKLLSLDRLLVTNLKLQELKNRLHGVPGTFAILELEKVNQNNETYLINLTRGTPIFMDYQDKFGVANAAQIDVLLLKKREEQKVCLLCCIQLSSLDSTESFLPRTV